jgi:hypothetical protein
MPVAFVKGDVDGLDASFISPDESAAGGERRAAPGEPRERPHLLPGGTTAAPAGDHGGADRQDLRALGAVRAARERGLDVPGDVSVVGYDDTPLLADAHPPLTSLQPVRGMGAVTRSGGDALARAATATHGCVPAGVGGDASVRPELSLLIRSSVHHNGALEVRLESRANMSTPAHLT